MRSAPAPQWTQTGPFGQMRASRKAKAASSFWKCLAVKIGWAIGGRPMGVDVDQMTGEELSEFLRPYQDELLALSLRRLAQRAAQEKPSASGQRQESDHAA